MAARFIVLDGLDGTGKSTQCRLLADWLCGQGIGVVTCREPGGTPLGDALRSILLDHAFDMTPMSEAMLFMASRAELVKRVIRPALAEGKWVVSDRFALATVVYQGHAGGLETDDLWELARIATLDRQPDLTVVLDLPVDTATRRRGRTADRIEQRDANYQERVRQGYLDEARQQPDRLAVVNAGGDVTAVHNEIRALVLQRLM